MQCVRQGRGGNNGCVCSVYARGEGIGCCTPYAVHLVAHLPCLLRKLVVLQASGNITPGCQTVDKLYQVNDDIVQVQ